jgi:hypothetical protein
LFSRWYIAQEPSRTPIGVQYENRVPENPKRKGYRQRQGEMERLIIKQPQNALLNA